jgi:malonyl-CoA O-methyltransferase
MAKPTVPEKQQVAYSFDHAALQYDDVAILQRQTADELLERLDLVKIQPKTVLDLGTGTGRNLSLLAKRYPKAKITALDLAPAMLKQAKQRFKADLGLKRWLPTSTKIEFITGDAEQLPLADNSVDMVFSNLALQWCDPLTSFQEIQRVLKPGGLLSFASLGPETLHELRQSWAQVDDYPHVNVFYDMHDVAEAMMQARLAEPVLDVERVQLSYDSVMSLMKDLKTLGAHNVNSGRNKGLTGKDAMQKMFQAYEQFRDQKMQLPASYEVIYGHAWCSENQQVKQDDGSVSIPIDVLKSQIQK